MAILPEDDKQNKQLAGEGGEASAIAGQGAAGGSSGGSVAGQGGVSTAGVGAGGAGAWTNIQAYLGANQGDTSTSRLLNDKVGNQFTQEQGNLEKSAGEAKDTGKKQVETNKIGQDKASQLISQAGNQYGYTSLGQQADPQYQSTVGQVKGSLNAQYQQNPWSYVMGQPTQNYGQGLRDDSQFKNMVDGIYNQSAGGVMGSGAMALQHQIDQDNSNVVNTRNDLSSRYQALQKMAYGDDGQGGAVKDVNDALTQYGQQFATDQSDLKNYLTGQGSTYRGAIDSTVDQQEQQRKSFLNNYKDFRNNLGVDTYHMNQDRERTNNAQDQMDVINRYNLNGGDFEAVNYGYQGPVASESNVVGVDTERNRYNSIMDMLGLGDKIDRSAEDYALGDLDAHHTAYHASLDNPNIDDHSLIKGSDWLKQQPIVALPNRKTIF
jgi:hypothetical protein